VIERPSDDPSATTAREGSVDDLVELREGGDSHQHAGDEVPTLTTE
jgi:hypothetical protein